MHFLKMTASMYTEKEPPRVLVHVTLKEPDREMRILWQFLGKIKPWLLILKSRHSVSLGLQKEAATSACNLWFLLSRLSAMKLMIIIFVWKYN